MSESFNLLETYTSGRFSQRQTKEENMGILQFYADLWTNNVVQYADMATLYSYFAVASLIVVVVALIMAIFKRADGIAAAGLIGQHFLVAAIPFIVSFALGFFAGTPAL